MKSMPGTADASFLWIKFPNREFKPIVEIYLKPSIFLPCSGKAYGHNIITGGG